VKSDAIRATRSWTKYTFAPSPLTASTKSASLKRAPGFHERKRATIRLVRAVFDIEADIERGTKRPARGIKTLARSFALSISL